MSPLQLVESSNAPDTRTMVGLGWWAALGLAVGAAGVAALAAGMAWAAAAVANPALRTSAPPVRATHIFLLIPCLLSEACAVHEPGDRISVRPRIDQTWCPYRPCGVVPRLTCTCFSREWGRPPGGTVSAVLGLVSAGPVGEGAGDGGGPAGDLQQAVDVFQVRSHGSLGYAQA